MTSTSEHTTVAIIGAGVSGLTVANFLHANGIACVVLERQSEARIEARQRAGNVEARAVDMYELWGLADRVIDGPPFDGSTEFRVDGTPHFFRDRFPEGSEPRHLRLCPQQLLVRKLIQAFREAGGDLRFEASDVTLSGIEGDRPTISYRDASVVERTLTCDFIAGCDGYHGVSRASIPPGHLTAYARDFGISWLNVLADVPAKVVMAIHERGFAARYQRGRASRIYLQCRPTDTVEDWPDARVWDELGVRMGEPEPATGPITDKLVFPLRSEVFEPMRHGRLFLVGDAAHIISPVGGKGMNLALFDAETFSNAVLSHVRDGDPTGLDSYSATCLRRVWRYQDFSASYVEMLHDGGGAGIADGFARKLTRARLDRLLTSETAAMDYSSLMAGDAD